MSYISLFVCVEGERIISASCRCLDSASSVFLIQLSKYSFSRTSAPNLANRRTSGLDRGFATSFGANFVADVCKPSAAPLIALEYENVSIC